MEGTCTGEHGIGYGKCIHSMSGCSTALNTALRSRCMQRDVVLLQCHASVIDAARAAVRQLCTTLICQQTLLHLVCDYAVTVVFESLATAPTDQNAVDPDDIMNPGKIVPHYSVLLRYWQQRCYCASAATTTVTRYCRGSQRVDVLIVAMLTAGVSASTVRLLLLQSMERWCCCISAVI
eukprot:15486-Heterococcus_DN1.PRE.1